MIAVPSISSDDDRTLLRAWSRGRDEEAFTQFVQRYLGMVQGSALRKTAQPELAEEVAQEVFALAARRAAALAEHPCAGAWLHRTAVFQSANVLRRERKHRRIAAAMSDLPDTSPDSALPDSVLPHLDDALNSLPENDRRAVLLRFGERQSYEQMAARLGKSADACQKQTSRALERLRGLLAPHAALPAAALSAGLMASLTTPATAAAGKVSAVAIAAASQVSLASLFQHLLQTMSTGKQIAAAAGVVALLAAVPLGLQMSEAGTLRGQIAAHQPARPASPALAMGTPAPDKSGAETARRIVPGVGTAEADRTLAMLRSLRGRMLTSTQLVDIAQQLMDLPHSHMAEAIKVLADFPGMMPAMPLRMVIFSRWAELDPTAALAASASLKDPMSEQLIKHALATGWLERDPHELAAWLRDNPRSDSLSAGTLSGMLAEKILLLDRETVQQLREVEGDGGYRGSLVLEWEHQVGGEDIAKLADELLADATDWSQRQNLLMDVAAKLAGDDPRAALDFVLTHPDAEGAVNQDALAVAVDVWAEKDLPAAAAWAWSQSRNNEDGATHVWKALSKQSAEEILAFLAKAPDESARLYSLQRTALESVSDPEKSLRLLDALPEAQRWQAMESFGQIRAGESLMKTSEWLLTLPEGPGRDAAIRGFAPVLAQSEVESAMIWAANITDADQRGTLLQEVGREWLQRSPDAAHQWLQTTDKLTDADRAAINSGK